MKATCQILILTGILYSQAVADELTAIDLITICGTQAPVNIPSTKSPYNIDGRVRTMGMSEQCSVCLSDSGTDKVSSTKSLDSEIRESSKH